MHDASASATLDDSPSHLLHRVLQIALEIYSAELGDSALSQRQYAVLSALDDAEGLTQADLVKTTGIDRSTLADLVARMAAKGLLARERSVSDGRANLVQLTDEGRAALADAAPKVAAADAKILELLSPPKRDSFLKLLRKLVHARDGEDAAPKSDRAALKAQKKADKSEKKKKSGEDKPRKKDKLAKKLKKLPMPDLSPGVTGEDDERVQAGEEKTA
ncbi:MAG TPA: MarR family transcriptional regulator [Asticcacaulis sp.]|nr:MarR family transcriptional regulator [Asticcacaulis sp.]